MVILWSTHLRIQRSKVKWWGKTDKNTNLCSLKELAVNAEKPQDDFSSVPFSLTCGNIPFSIILHLCVRYNPFATHTTTRWVVGCRGAEDGVWVKNGKEFPLKRKYGACGKQFIRRWGWHWARVGCQRKSREKRLEKFILNKVLLVLNTIQSSLWEKFILLPTIFLSMDSQRLLFIIESWFIETKV